jgi:hypothetical protein
MKRLFAGIVTILVFAGAAIVRNQAPRRQKYGSWKLVMDMGVPQD